MALSADGTTALVGGPEDNVGAGAVWVYTRANGVWTQQAKLLGSSTSQGVAAQGQSVALSADGNTAAIGGINDNTGTGAIWVFTRTNGVWTQQGPKFWGTVLQGLSHQGVSVALSADGNTLLEGGDLFNNNIGAAWVFRRSNGEWDRVHFDLLTGAGALGMSHQGASVALSADGNTAVIGGPGDNSGLGAAWVFAFGNGAWSQQAKLVGGGATGNAAFGTSVAFSADGNTAMVGGPGDAGNTGAVWVFTRGNGQWPQQGLKLVGSDAVAGRYLGQSVALSGDGNTAFAGGPGGKPGLFGSQPSIGATWVFTRSNLVWTQQGTELVGAGAAGNDALEGTAVAITGDGNTAMVGGPADNGGVGAVWVFGRPAGQTPPVITSQPASQTIAVGQTATLTVVASGPAPLSYQWYQGVSGATSMPVGTNASAFTTPALSSTAIYWVRITNPYGSVDSAAATITVPSDGPLISRVANAAGGRPTIAPNTWIEIHGSNLAPAGDTRIWQTADLQNGQLPIQLDRVSVTVNGKPAYVYYISPAQVNVLTPPDAMPASVQVQVTKAGSTSAAISVPAQPIAPGFFVFGAGPYAAAEHADWSYLGPTDLYPGETTPAKPGEVIVLYGSGFGPVATPVVGGSVVQSGLLPSPPIITIGGIAAQVQFAGLIAPGEFQFNVVVPADAAPGDNVLSAIYNGVTTQGGVLLRIER